MSVLILQKKKKLLYLFYFKFNILILSKKKFFFKFLMELKNKQNLYHDNIIQTVGKCHKLENTK